MHLDSPSWADFTCGLLVVNHIGLFQLVTGSNPRYYFFKIQDDDDDDYESRGALRKKHVQIQDIGMPTHLPINKNIVWSPPPTGWVKVNVDGAMSASSNKAGCGCVIRDHDGQWIAGFTYFLGYCSAFEAEEWSILTGLQSAWDLGFKKGMEASEPGMDCAYVPLDPYDVSAIMPYVFVKKCF